MEKRGQFYLLAAFIIVIVMTGLNQLYSSASAPNERKVIYSLLEEASYEAKELFKNMITNDEDDDHIKDEMRKLINYYSNRYTNADIVVVLGNETKVYIVNSTTSETKTVINNNVDVIVKGDTKTLEFKQGRRVYVIIRTEKDGEKIFLVK